MTNTTETYWSADGQSLQTYAKNIETLGGRDKPPMLRGTDIVVPYAPGSRWIPKVPDSRTISLAMWVRGVGDDNSTPADQAQQYDENWRALRNLLWTPGRQFELQKRLQIDGVLRSMTAMAEYSNGLDTTMLSRTAARFAVDLKLADPYFYDDNPVNATLANGANTVTVPGDAPSNQVIISINGARDGVTLINETLGITLEFRESLLADDSAIIVSSNYTAQTFPSGKPMYNSSAKVRRTGSALWFPLAPGANEISLGSISGLGTVTITARGAYL